MTKAEEKRLLRTAILAAREQLSEKYKASSSAAIRTHLMSMTEYREADTVFCFVSLPQEIDTHPLLRSALAQGKRLCVPLCVGGAMELRQITALEQLSPGVLGIPQPLLTAPTVAVDEVDFSIVPCLTCDRSGRRLGLGGGYYDRFLSTYRSAAAVVCRERLLREELPVEPHDMPIPWVVTEKGLYEDGIPARIE